MCGVDLAELMNPVCRPSSPKGVFQQDPHKTKKISLFWNLKIRKISQKSVLFFSIHVYLGRTSKCNRIAQSSEWSTTQVGCRITTGGSRGGCLIYLWVTWQVGGIKGWYRVHVNALHLSPTLFWGLFDPCIKPVSTVRSHLGIRLLLVLTLVCLYLHFMYRIYGYLHDYGCFPAL